jgi:hypothetical protein
MVNGQSDIEVHVGKLKGPKGFECFMRQKMQKDLFFDKVKDLKTLPFPSSSRLVSSNKA